MVEMRAKLDFAVCTPQSAVAGESVSKLVPKSPVRTQAWNDAAVDDAGRLVGDPRCACFPASDLPCGEES